jgi:hypothetical protein
VEENWIQLTCFDNHAEDLSVLVRMPRGYNPLTAAFFGTNVSEKERLNEGPRNVNLALAFWWWWWGGAGVGLQRRHKKTRYITPCVRHFADQNQGFPRVFLAPYKSLSMHSHFLKVHIRIASEDFWVVNLNALDLLPWDSMSQTCFFCQIELVLMLS